VQARRKLKSVQRFGQSLVLHAGNGVGVEGPLRTDRDGDEEQPDESAAGARGGQEERLERPQTHDRCPCDESRSAARPAMASAGEEDMQLG
jgi:hypothetical protein